MGTETKLEEQEGKNKHVCDLREVKFLDVSAETQRDRKVSNQANAIKINLMDQEGNKSSEPQINGAKERGENGMREGMTPQMRAKEQIEKGEKDAIGEEMERCIIEKETRAD